MGLHHKREARLTGNSCSQSNLNWEPHHNIGILEVWESLENCKRSMGITQECLNVKSSGNNQSKPVDGWNLSNIFGEIQTDKAST